MPYAIRGFAHMWRPVSSFITKWGTRISQQRFDLESPKFYTNLHTGRVYNHTRYDITIYFRLEVIAKKQAQMPPQMASGESSRERFKRRSRNFTCLSATTGPTNWPDITLLVASGGLQNAIKTGVIVYVYLFTVPKWTLVRLPSSTWEMGDALKCGSRFICACTML